MALQLVCYSLSAQSELEARFESAARLCMLCLSAAKQLLRAAPSPAANLLPPTLRFH
jgi:hypothetical protein